MKIIKLSLCISMVGAFATLPPAYANEVVENCTQVVNTGGSDSDIANNESCAAVSIPFDYGDATDPTFPVLLTSNGARHQLGTPVYLGKCVDGDSGLLQGGANADDASESQPVYGVCETDAFGKLDDEDGVAIAELHVGDTKNTVQVTASSACKLNAWVDWNQDGSWGGTGEQVFIDQVLAAGVNDLTMDVPAFAAEGTIYTRFRCSTAGGDGIGGEAADGEVEDYALNVLPAIPKTPVSVGDFIWEDTDKDGKQTAGENPLAGATVSLLDSKGAPAKDLTGTIVADVTTDGTGKYLFGNLPEGDYSVKVTPPTDYIVSPSAGDVDDVPANDDSNCAVQGDGSITTALFSLSAGGEPIDDGDADANSNLSVDCGFYKPTEPTHSLGNKVWIDDGAGTAANANNGTLDAGEAAVADGVLVELRNAAGALLTSTTTSKGFYLFSGLTAGDYKVCVAASNFADTAILKGFSASTGGNEADANAGVDSNDNGSDVLADGLCSNVITLDANAPTGETDTASGTAGDDGMNTPDALSDLTVDFAVIPPPPPTPMSVGDTVWIDADENGVQGKDELPLVGAVVTLLDKDGNPVKDLAGNTVDYLQTDASGKYLFSNLPEGEYIVRVQAPDGYAVTQGGAAVDTDPSNTDSNCAVTGGNVQTLPFLLSAGAESITDGDTDANTDLSVDCGFYVPKVPTHSLGNRVWVDANNNGAADVGETPAVAGIALELKDANGAALGTTTTDAEGRYLFSNLPAGSYQVCVVADNFAAGNILEGFTASTGGNVEDANTDIDGDDNGTDDIATGLCSNFVVLDDQEPTGEAGINDQPGVDGVGTDDNRSNLSVDFGIVPPAVTPTAVHSIGNMVWVDNGAGDATKADNGQFDEGEGLLNGIKLELRDTTGAVIDSTMTAGGYYLFPGLNAGEYQVCVAAANFTGMGKLVGHTAGVNGKEADANANGDSNDNSGAMTANGLCSNVIVLDDKEPTGELPTGVGIAGDDGMGTDDNRSNLTVDFAVLPPAVAPTPVAVGDRIWIDTDEDGQQDENEIGLENATVTLLDKSGNPVNDLDGKPVAALTTAADGLYLFENLPQGEYVVRVAAPAGYITTQGGAAVNDDPSNTDSNCQVVDGQTQTSAFNLTTDNLTVDCGFYQPKAPTHSIGNRVWIDNNNNGLADNDELPASAGVGLELKDASGTVIKATTTDATGRYLFSGLAAGDYQVCVVADNFAAGNLLEGYTASTGGTIADANTNVDGDDNGSDDIKAGLCSNLVVLDDQEPTGEITATGADGVDGMGTDDNRSNLTVDFGIVPPAVPPQVVSVGDKIWLDANENGQQDENESGLENATVTLLDKSGNPVNDLDGKPVAAVTTAANGLYLFENLPAGEYLIRVVAPDGYITTQGGAAVNDDPSNTDSNCQAVDGQTQTGVFNLTTDNLTVDCGFYVPKVPMHSLGNTVWVDANNNGLFDKDEQPVVDGVVMELLDKNGAVMAYTETKDGYYLFSGLATGEYSVCVAHGNFDQGFLKGYTASTMGDEADVNAGIDNADNGDNDTQDGLCSEMIILDDQSPTGELPTASGKAGDDGMSTDDNRSNLTIDFGVVAPVEPPKTVSVGDYIWVDVNENGQQDAGDTPLAGATVTLLDKDGNPVVLSGDMAIAPIITGADGKYVFSNLPEGQYSISVAAPADSDYMPIQGGAKVDDDASNTDSNCDVDTGKTSLFTLTAGAEPDAAADGDGIDGNMTVDCGFYLPATEKATISGTVSVDTTGDSSGETPLAGITLSLLKPDGTPVLDADGKPVTTLTNANGEYLFANLDAGDYLVAQTQPADYNSVTDGDTTSPEDDATNTDTTDDRIPVTVIAGETDDGNDFVERAPVKPNTVSVGDFIWIDANENGQQDKDDIGLAGATVTLMDKDGNPVVLSDGTSVAPIVTAADGKYVFGNLPEGEYSIRVTAPQGSAYLPTQGGAKVDNDASNTDSNCSVDTGKTSLFTLTAGAEPDAAADGDGIDGNMTVDCGFYLPKKPMHSIGNTVWVDSGEGSAANNGQFDQGETLPSGVQMELRDAAGALIRSTQTDKGFYLFSALEAGEYKVCVAGSNFNDGAALDGFTASTAEKEADANTNGDNNDNGDSTASDGLCSNLIVLDDKEPNGEQPTASGIAGNDGMETDDNRSNLTVDFAVVPVQTVTPGTPVAVGNQIWVDSNANGAREATEGFLENAVVTLTDASGRAVADLDGNTVAPHTTGADGLYLFDNLPEGEYIVTVEPPAGFSPTIGGIDADDDASDIDSNCRVNPINTTIETHPFTLTAGAEPDADGDDANGNMTVDCGFYGSMSLGDKVWLDNNANGQQDNGEPGIRGVSVSLLEADGITPATDIDGKPVAAVMTDDNGNYLFQNLKPGNYIVVMSPAANSGYSATKGGVDPDADPSNTDSNCKAVDGRFQTPTFSLMPSVTSDGNSFSNVSVDCGLFRPLNLGSRLWLDLNNDGKQDGGEPGIPGATVTLLTVDGKPVSNIFGDVLQPQTTDGDGKYFFGNLREGDYIVKVIPPAGYAATIPNADPNDDNPTDSNGIPASDGSISSGVIRLTPGAEPEDGGMTNTTIGFGLVANLSVAVPTLSQWGVAIMSMLLATAAFFRRRRED